jgi:hypothetical protein
MDMGHPPIGKGGQQIIEKFHCRHLGGLMPVLDTLFARGRTAQFATQVLF